MAAGKTIRRYVDGAIVNKETDSGVSSSANTNETASKDGPETSSSSVSETLSCTAIFEGLTGGTDWYKSIKGKHKSGQNVKWADYIVEYDENNNVKSDPAPAFYEGGKAIVNTINRTAPTDGNATFDFSMTTNGNSTFDESEYNSITV